MSFWARAVAAVVVAAVAGVVAGSLLRVATPSAVIAPRPGPVLETVTPAQLAAMNLRLTTVVQPADLPTWLGTVGVRMPAGVRLAGDAEVTVRQGTDSVRDVVERVLARATVAGRNPRTRGPTIVRRLVWVIVGTRDAAGGLAAQVQMVWLVDAHTGRQLVELPVPPPPAGGIASPGG